MLQTTDEHPFWVIGTGWVKAGELQVGQQFLSADGDLVTLSATSIEEHPEGISVYNLTVEEDHTFFVSATSGDEMVWVHNQDGPVGGPPPTTQGGAAQTPWGAFFDELWSQIGKTGEAIAGVPRAAKDNISNTAAVLLLHGGNAVGLVTDETMQQSSPLVKYWAGHISQGTTPVVQEFKDLGHGLATGDPDAYRGVGIGALTAAAGGATGRPVYVTGNPRLPVPMPSAAGGAAAAAVDAAVKAKQAFSIDEAQLGKKLAKHVRDFGLDPSNPAHRQQITDLIKRIGSTPEKTINGTFSGQGIGGARGLVQFRIIGNDVVVTTPGGEFVTLLKDGVTQNSSVMQALEAALGGK